MCKENKRPRRKIWLRTPLRKSISWPGGGCGSNARRKKERRGICTGCESNAQKRFPFVNAPLELQDGQAFLIKSDILKGIMWFSYQEGSFSNMIPLTAYEVKQIINENKAGRKPATILKNQEEEKKNDFVSSLGEDNINRFDEKKKNKNKIVISFGGNHKRI